MEWNEGTQRQSRTEILFNRRQYVTEPSKANKINVVLFYWVWHVFGLEFLVYFRLFIPFWNKGLQSNGALSEAHFPVDVVFHATKSCIGLNKLKTQINKLNTETLQSESIHQVYRGVTRRTLTIWDKERRYFVGWVISSLLFSFSSVSNI